MAKSAGETKSAGIQHVSIARINSNFVPMGTAADPNTVADGTTTSALHVSWADALALAQPTQAIEKTLGGNQPGPSINLGTNDRGEATLTLAMNNETLMALIEGTTNDSTTVSDWLMMAHNPRLDNFLDYIVIASAKVVGDGIAEHWINKIYLNTKLQITEYISLSQAAGTNSHMTTLTLTPNESTKTPWGALLSTTSMNITDDKTDYIEIRTDAPLSITTHVASVSDTEFTLGFRPISTDVLQVSQVFSKDGVTTNPTSVNTTTGVVVIPSAAASETWVGLYETNYVAI
jgi:hypothetical protein